jgi:hypothetical protein
VVGPLVAGGIWVVEAVLGALLLGPDGLGADGLVVLVVVLAGLGAEVFGPDLAVEFGLGAEVVELAVGLGPETEVGAVSLGPEAGPVDLVVEVWVGLGAETLEVPADLVVEVAMGVDGLPVGGLTGALETEEVAFGLIAVLVVEVAVGFDAAEN